MDGIILPVLAFFQTKTGVGTFQPPASTSIPPANLWGEERV